MSLRSCLCIEQLRRRPLACPGHPVAPGPGSGRLEGQEGLEDDNPGKISGHSLPALLSARADACPRCTRSSPRRAAPVGMSQMRQQCAGSPQFHCRRSESFIIVPPLCSRYSPAQAQLDRDARRCLDEIRTRLLSMPQLNENIARDRDMARAGSIPDAERL